MSFLKPVLLDNGRLTLAPVGSCVYEIRPLFNAASKNLATVAAVPATFSFIPAVGTTYYLTAISIAFSSTGTPDPTDFGNIAALANGIDLDLRSEGTTNTILNIKDNMDIALAFFQYSTISGTLGFLNNADLYMGSLTFDGPIILKSTTSDFIRAVVKSVTTSSGSDLRIYAHLYKQI